MPSGIHTIDSFLTLMSNRKYQDPRKILVFSEKTNHAKALPR